MVSRYRTMGWMNLQILLKLDGQDKSVNGMLGSESSLGSVRYLMLQDSDEVYLIDKAALSFFGFS